VCIASRYYFIVITAMLSFQTLLIWAGAAETDGGDAGSGGRKDFKQSHDEPGWPDEYGGRRWLIGGCDPSCARAGGVN
jgi:hypothetical protein